MTIYNSLCDEEIPSISCFMKFKLFPKYLFNDIYLLHFYRIIVTKNYKSTMRTTKFKTFLDIQTPWEKKSAQKKHVCLWVSPVMLLICLPCLCQRILFHAQIVQKVSVVAQNITQYMYFILILKYLH